MINSSNDKRKVVLGIVSAWILSSIFLGAGWFIAYRLEFFFGTTPSKNTGHNFLAACLISRDRHSLGRTYKACVTKY